MRGMRGLAAPPCSGTASCSAAPAQSVRMRSAAQRLACRMPHAAMPPHNATMAGAPPSPAASATAAASSGQPTRQMWRAGGRGAPRSHTRAQLLMAAAVSAPASAGTGAAQNTASRQQVSGMLAIATGSASLPQRPPRRGRPLAGGRAAASPREASAAAATSPSTAAVNAGDPEPAASSRHLASEKEPPEPQFSPLHYNILAFCERMAPTADELKSRDDAVEGWVP
eukprot:359622-Chlamydomonas_euryale.AAC.18